MKIIGKVWSTLVVLVVVASFLTSCSTSGDSKPITTEIIQNSKSLNDKAPAGEMPQFEFKETEKDLGMILEGEQVIHTFKYKNVGKGTLVISSVSSTCGCTVADFSKEPLAFGEEGSIEVMFNSEGRQGVQDKVITILANTEPNRIELRIKANVVVPK